MNTEIQNELNDAFNLLRQIPVTDKYVEMMADAKACLRKAYAMLETSKEANSDGE